MLQGRAGSCGQSCSCRPERATPQECSAFEQWPLPPAPSEPFPSRLSCLSCPSCPPIRPRPSASFVFEPDITDHHGFVDRLHHVIHGQRGDRNGGERFHLDTRL